MRRRFEKRLCGVWQIGFSLLLYLISYSLLLSTFFSSFCVLLIVCVFRAAGGRFDVRGLITAFSSPNCVHANLFVDDDSFLFSLSPNDCASVLFFFTVPFSLLKQLNSPVSPLTYREARRGTGRVDRVL